MSDLVPNIDSFRPVVLKVLNSGESLPFQQLVEAVADVAGLDEAARAQKIASGQYRYANRIGWACSGLTQAGLLARPKRGTYRITDNGRIVAARNLFSYSEKDMLEWPMWREYQQEIAERKTTKTPMFSTQISAAHGEDIDPIEVITSKVESLQAQTETQLRRMLQQSSPEFFEKSVVELLWAMGYGGAHGEKEHVGKAGDGGIDGVIRQDALGLSKVYIQAKRYADDNKVQRPAIQQFFGSLTSQGADRGVFITTSSFSEGARREAESYKTIVLIDGVRLTSLMLDYGVGVRKAREFTVFEVDENFFEEDLI